MCPWFDYLKSNWNIIKIRFLKIQFLRIEASAKFKFKGWEDENETTGLINLAVVYLLVNVYLQSFIVKVTIVVYKLKRYHTYVQLIIRSRGKNVDYFP